MDWLLLIWVLIDPKGFLRMAAVTIGVVVLFVILTAAVPDLFLLWVALGFALLFFAAGKV